MISTTEASKLIEQNVSPLAPVDLPLQHALCHTLASDVYAVMDIPAYPQSSMDGYAFKFTDWQMQNELMITGEMPAGKTQATDVNPQTAIRIFTGAALPSQVDTVVMQEKVTIADGRLIIDDEKLQKGSNVRMQGSEIKTGELAMRKDTLLTPAAIGFLAGIGLRKVAVYPFPKITIIVTGDELKQPGTPLGFGQVYDSSSFALRSALQQRLFKEIETRYAPDNLQALISILQNALECSDVVLLTGGVSAGNYDFVIPATEACGVEKIFHKVRQRPGKPLYFGKKGEKLVFGLPGNPASVLTCMYRYVFPALGSLSRRNINLQMSQAPLSRTCSKPAGLTQFLKGFFDGRIAQPLDAQESYRMRSFAVANCLVELPETETEIVEGSVVNIYLLPD